MRLNSLRPGEGSRSTPKRVGRGVGSGLGKTCARGHKGQKARAGGYHKVGFEGGQMPLQRRLPKVGFNSRLARVTAEIRLSELGKVSTEVIDLAALQTAGMINRRIKFVKVFASGSLDRAVKLRGLRVSRGARAAIEAAGGAIEP